jgi:hypothetical protein
VLTPDQAKARSVQWSHDFDDWREFKGVKSWSQWDHVDSETRLRLECILLAGYDNITREKVGLPPMTDDEALAHARKLYEVRRKRRVR